MLRYLALLMGGFSSFASANAAESLDVALTLSGVQGTAPIYVTLYDNDDTFLDSEKAKYVRVLPANDSGHYVLVDIEPGEYGMVFFQDTNRNNKLDRYFFGPPKEPAGLSNNPKVWFGPPLFADCRVSISADTRLDVQLK